VPVVCNDNPDQQALIQASGAGRCVPYTAEDFARAVVGLLRLAPEERRAMVERGRELVARERDYRQLASGVAARYQAIIQAAQPRKYVRVNTTGMET
jgi:glycosyltransferase involved in cell wall biosynthesis